MAENPILLACTPAMIVDPPLHALFALAVALLSFPALPAAGQEHPALPDQRGDTVPCIANYRTAIVIDGFQTDWEEEVPRTERVTRLVAGEPEFDWTGPADASFMMWCRVGGDHLYFAVVARDNVIVAPSGRRGGDRFAFVFAPDSASASADRIRIVEIPIWPVHDGGTSTPVFQNGPQRGQPVPNASAEVSYRDNGFFMEAAIPRSVVGPSVGFAPIPFAAIQMDWDHDADREREVQIATAPFDPRDVRSLGTLDFVDAPPSIRALNQALHLPDGTEPAASAWGRFAGDARQKRAVILGRYLVVYGPGLPSWDLIDFPISTGELHRVVSLETQDLDGNGFPALLVTHTERHLGTEVEILSVFELRATGFHRVIHQEVARRLDDGTSATARVTRTAGSQPEIRIDAPELDSDARQRLHEALPESPGGWQAIPLGADRGRHVRWRRGSSEWTGSFQ